MNLKRRNVTGGEKIRKDTQNIKYFSNLPQGECERTLTVYLDCRHDMPGMEPAHQTVSWLDRYPKPRAKIVAMIQLTEFLMQADLAQIQPQVG
jgi:hypothetical protein